MYSWEREKLQKRHKHPSFSTTLLDEIYRSIDGFDEKPAEDFEAARSRHGGGGGRHGCPKMTIKNVRIGDHRNVDEDEDVVSFRRACLIEKWMEQKVSDKVTGRGTKPKPQPPPFLSDSDSDPMFFSSSSSDSSSGALSSSSSLSDTEFLESTRKSSSLRTSCFSSSKPKPVKTTVEKPKTENEDLIKSKSAAVKMYLNLKKMKQPISPGARLTSFLNALFANGKPKPAVKPSPEDPRPPQPSTSAAAARSCLNKTPRMNNGVKRTVRFDPVGVIVDEDCRPCGHKRIYDRDFAAGDSPEFQETKKNQGISRGIALRAGISRNQWKKDLYSKEEEEEDDKLSDCSSDLFEIDHLALFAGNRRFREELPVYESTQLPATAFIRSSHP